MIVNFIDLLTQRQTDYRARATALLDTARTEQRMLTIDEKAEADALEADLADIGTRLTELNEIHDGRLRASQYLRVGTSGGVTDGAGNSPQFMQRTAAWSTDARALSDDQAITHARSALDATKARAGQVPEHGILKVSDVITGQSGEAARMARWTIAASNPAYETAFAKVLADPTRGHLEWSTEERNAYTAVNELSRAMSLTVGNGGYMVPFTLDPSIMLTNDGHINPLRQLATVKLTTTNTWNGITSAGATAEWKTEASQVADGSPTVAQPSIPTFFGDSFVPYSFEVGMDTVDFLGELSTVLVDAAENLKAIAYTTGGGSSAPQGIVTGLAGTASEINTTGSEAHSATDPFALQNALPARFSANATWQSHISTANVYRQMETTAGSLLFPELRNDTPSLLGKRWYENSNMDGTINAAATANNYAMIYGDVRAGYFIVDRIGATLELIPNLMGADGRPTGQRGALLWFRTGAEVVVPQALRLLDIPTTA
ncbi:MAG TPA: phage major capsid protein [Ilumatobacteraceae bacterium]|nr:phage major capsid protein [Ilumatobacteraceae bacterium]HRB04230.1 phage major capsid protein [Ilumatobacteraceae bacterium]